MFTLRGVRAGRSPRRLLIVLLPVLAMVGGLLVAASPAQAIAPVHFVNGGTGAPSASLGGYAMTPFPADPQPSDPDAGWTNITSVASPLGGNVGFSATMEHYKATNLTGGWGNGYTGDVYSGGPTTGLTLTLPAGTTAFYFYALGNFAGTWNISAKTDNNTSSGPIAVTTDPSGSNAANYFGFYTTDDSSIGSITVTADSGANTISVGEFGISAPWHYPTFTSPNTATFTAGTPGSFSITTVVDPAHGVATVTCHVCTMPAGLTFSPGPNGTATIAGTPAAGAGGYYQETIWATNTVGPSSQTLGIIVYQAPTLSGPTSLSFAVGSAGSVSYTSTGWPAAPVIDIASGSLPTGLSLGAPVDSLNAHGDRVTQVALSGTPVPGTGGSYTVTLVASNGTLPDATLTIHITVHAGVTITSPNHTTFTALHANSFQVTTSGGFPPGPVAFSETGALPPGVTFSSSGVLSGNPPVSSSGLWHVTIHASNGYVATSQAFTLSVVAPAVPARSMADPGDLTEVTVDATGECFSWTVSGFAPYAPVTLIAYPRLTTGLPVTVGTYSTSSHGSVTINACLPDSAHGSYTLLAAGYQLDGSVRYEKARTIVQP